MRRLPCALVLLMLLLIPAARSEGTPIQFAFTVDFTSGPLDGQSFLGSFSVDGDDCPGGICPDGVFRPGLPLDVLSFNITIAGIALDITDEFFYPDDPTVLFFGGNVVGLTYQGSTADAFLKLFLFPDSTNDVFFAASEGSTGGVSNIVPVPEPATLTLLGLGLAGIGVRRWRQRKAT
jgi:hypothetical protein